MSRQPVQDTPSTLTEKDVAGQINATTPLTFRLLEEGDIPVILELEQEAFSDPWSVAIWQKERKNALATWLVAETAGDMGSQIIGYAGIWLVAGEAQVMRVAVRENLRGNGLGLQLIRVLLTKARELGAEAVTLEVRESNRAALSVYKKCGFVSVGVRPRYYEDTHEGAVIMWLRQKKQEGAEDSSKDGENEIGSDAVLP